MNIASFLTGYCYGVYEVFCSVFEESHKSIPRHELPYLRGPYHFIVRNEMRSGRWNGDGGFIFLGIWVVSFFAVPPIYGGITNYLYRNRHQLFRFMR